MGRKKLNQNVSITIEEETKTSKKVKKDISQLFDEEDNIEAIKVLESIIRTFEKDNKDSKTIDQEEFLDAVTRLDLSDDDMEKIFEIFKDDGYTLISNDDIDDVDFDESKLSEMGEEDDLDIDEDDMDESEKEVVNFEVDNYNYETSDVKINDSVKLYLKDIGRVPLLKANEEQELAKRIIKGDIKAKQQLISANLRLVVSIAKH